MGWKKRILQFFNQNLHIKENCNDCAKSFINNHNMYFFMLIFFQINKWNGIIINAYNLFSSALLQDFMYFEDKDGEDN